MQQGAFVISLDFELMWGVSDKRTIESYGANIRNVRPALISLLNLMEHYGIRASVASVGMLWGNSLEQLSSCEYTPKERPSYTDPKYSNYEYLSHICVTKEEYCIYYSGIDLLKEIHKRGQDIECHTYSHYYCLERGQTIEQFDADLKLFKQINNLNKAEAIIFPRNQYASEHLRVCRQNGINIFRGNELDRFHAASSQEKRSRWNRLIRFLDNYINITGHHCYDPCKEEGLLNIRASRFFRPPTRFRFMENLKMRRIKNAMKHAAKFQTVYHLWWHPHNMGGDPLAFLLQLEEVFKHYQDLSQKYGMKSMSMRDVYKTYCDEA